MLDTGYEDEALQVIEDLTAGGIIIDKIIISHFHSDHIFGLKKLPNIPVYGSSRYSKTLAEFGFTGEECKDFAPSILVEEPLTLGFGRHKLELIPFPGHSECGMLVKIDEQFLHIADEVMFSADGTPLLPCLSGKKDIKRQLESLDKLKDFSSVTIIPSHGPVFEGSRLHRDIQNLSVYLNAVLKADGAIAYEESVKNCDCSFLQIDWHKYNCE